MRNIINNLYLTKESCPNWKKEHALKELIEMVSSKDGTISLKTSAEHSYLVLTTPKPILSIKNILNGIDLEEERVVEGGTKLALLVLLREKINFHFTNKNILCTFDFRMPRGTKIEMLHLISRPFLELPIQGTTIEIQDVTQEDLNKIASLENIEFMEKDKEHLKTEIKAIESLVKKNVAELDVILDSIFSKISIPVLTLKWNFFSKDEMEEWIKGKGIIGFVKQYLHKEQIDLSQYAQDERVIKYIKEICIDCYKDYIIRFVHL
ncbi:MAG: hypothetical protein NC310_08820 [Roseburia sp.]|nr:hypothetical protein [Roseburia sp.]